jgi:hypothetical protein
MKHAIFNITNMSISMFFKIVLITFWLLPNSIYPQELDNDKFDNYSKWIFSFYGAGIAGGPSKQIENVMRTSGFGDQSPGFFGSGTDYPETRIWSLPWMLDIHYRKTKLISIGIQISNSILRETIGYANPQGGLGQYLSLHYSTKTYAPIISFYLKEYMILGLGPSLNTLGLYEEDLGKEINHVKKNNIGLLTYINLRIHLFSIFSGNLIFQYRYTGNIKIGPFEKEDTIGISTPTPSIVIITFPETEINYSHFFIGIGIGIHL